MFFFPLAVIDAPPPLDALVYAGGIAVALIALGTIVHNFLGFARRMSRFLDDWEGQGVGDSLPERVGRLEGDVEQIKTRLMGRNPEPGSG